MLNKKKFKDVAYEYASGHSSVKDYKRTLMKAESEAFISGINYVRDKLLELSKTISGEDFNFTTIDNVIFGYAADMDFLDKEFIYAYFGIPYGTDLVSPFNMTEFQKKIFNNYKENNETVVLPIRQCGTTKLLSIIGTCEAFNGKKVLYLSDSLASAMYCVNHFDFTKDSPIDCLKQSNTKVVLQNGGSIKIGSGDNYKNLLNGDRYDVIIMDNFIYYNDPEAVYKMATTLNSGCKIIIATTYPLLNDNKTDKLRIYNSLRNKSGVILADIDDTFANVEKMVENFGEEEMHKILYGY